MGMSWAQLRVPCQLRNFLASGHQKAEGMFYRETGLMCQAKVERANAMLLRSLAFAT
jgi:hypothetical protein